MIDAQSWLFSEADILNSLCSCKLRTIYDIMKISILFSDSRADVYDAENIGLVEYGLMRTSPSMNRNWLIELILKHENRAPKYFISICL